MTPHYSFAPRILGQAWPVLLGQLSAMQAAALCLTSVLLLGLCLRVQSSGAGSGSSPRPSESAAA